MRGVEAFLSSYQGASIEAVRRGFAEVGVEDGQVLIFGELMDSASLFLTANSDTIYFLSFVDLTDGPMVLDVPVLPAPSAILGTIDDAWFRWVTDFGLPGPDRGEGGRYLLVGPGYEGPLPDSGFHVSTVRTTRACVLGRAFMADNDPAPAVAAIKQGFRIHPYRPGAAGTAIASFLAGDSPLAGLQATVGETVFVDAEHLAINTIAPNDFSFWEMIDSVVQREPAGSGDPEILGQLASIGIRKGHPFAPDERMRAILEEAVAVGNATARTLAFAARESEGFAYYPGSAWFNMLFAGGYRVHGSAPGAHGRRRRAQPERRRPQAQLADRLLLPGDRHHAGDVHAADRHRVAVPDRLARRRRCVPGRSAQLPARRCRPDIPQSRFWSVTVYDRQTRSMLQTDQLMPRLGSQSGTVRSNADGTTDLYFGPQAPEGKEDNWLQTLPGKGWFPILRLYSPGQAFFDKSWRAGELEPITSSSNGHDPHIGG